MKLPSFKPFIIRFLRDIKLYQRVLLHPRCPWPTRIFLGIAVAYALSPIDLIPDFIPVLGYIDDAIILPLLIYIALGFAPGDLIDQVRREMGDV